MKAAHRLGPGVFALVSTPTFAACMLQSSETSHELCLLAWLVGGLVGGFVVWFVTMALILEMSMGGNNQVP